MDYKKSRKRCMVLSLTGLGLVLIGMIIQWLELRILLIIGGFILLVYSRVSDYRHNRCPMCGALLPYRLSSITEHCPKYGEKLL